jgi:hypothetical protein
MTTITAIRDKLQDTSVERLKDILKPYFELDIYSSDFTIADLLTMMQRETDPQRMYKLSVQYQQLWINGHRPTKKSKGSK